MSNVDSSVNHISAAKGLVIKGLKRRGAAKGVSFPIEGVDPHCFETDKQTFVIG